MISVNIEKENRKYKKIKILGHALYDEAKDFIDVVLGFFHK